MQKDFRKIFAPPVFPGDEEKTRSAAILNTIGWSTLFVLVIILALRIIQGQDPNLAVVNRILAMVIVVIAFMLFMARTGYVRIASVVLVVTIWGALSYVSWVADGIRDVTFFGYSIPILLASLLLGWRGAVGIIFLSILSGWGLAYAETIQLLNPTLDEPLNVARDMTGVFVLIGVLIYLMISSLQNTLAKSQAVAQELSVSDAELNELHANLEQEVDERTSELQRRA